MDEDPVYLKKLADMIKETIEAYKQHRISESEYLQQVIDIENKVHSQERSGIPEIIKGNSAAISYFGFVTEIFAAQLKEHNDKEELSAQIAAGIDQCMQSMIYEQGKPLVDWQTNIDFAGKLKTALDDYLYEIKQHQNLNITWEQTDELVAECIKIGKQKYL